MITDNHLGVSTVEKARKPLISRQVRKFQVSVELPAHASKGDLHVQADLIRLSLEQRIPNIFNAYPHQAKVTVIPDERPENE